MSHSNVHSIIAAANPNKMAIPSSIYTKNCDGFCPIRRCCMSLIPAGSPCLILHTPAPTKCYMYSQYHITPNANMPIPNGRIMCPLASGNATSENTPGRLDSRRIESWSYRTAAAQLQCSPENLSYIGATPGASRGLRPAAATASASAPTPVCWWFGRRCWRRLVSLATWALVPPPSLGLIPLLI